MMKPIVVFPNSRESGWFSIERLRAEGPYEDVQFAKSGNTIVPGEGPLAGTTMDGTPVWCALLEGRLIIAPRTESDPPAPISDTMVVRGYYQLDPNSGVMRWQSINAPWDHNEIDEYRLLSNPSYQLYRLVPEQPEHIFLYGAGASTGSDGAHHLKAGNLPPLGKTLFEALQKAPELQAWRALPEEARRFFTSLTFEQAMDALDDHEEWARASWARDLELSLFFSRFRPEPANLYWKLAKIISRALRTESWTGAAVTLNYERLLEESMMRNEVFTVVKGVTFYDGDVPQLPQHQLFEVCYPHGACQFFLPQTCFAGEGQVIFGPAARWGSNAGVNHILNVVNIAKACQQRHIPIICRYQGSKRPTLNNYFVDVHRERMQALFHNAKTIAIVGVYCQHPGDDHLWTPLGHTGAKILYVNPDPEAQQRLRSWASEFGKIEGDDYTILAETFKDAFFDIARFSALR